uniref:Uncharacterized protein n=1 Tax=Opuntia streptacantha TaxID=393608 RepID=A0A7C8YN63_OPUST
MCLAEEQRVSLEIRLNFILLLFRLQPLFFHSSLSLAPSIFRTTLGRSCEWANNVNCSHSLLKLQVQIILNLLLALYSWDGSRTRHCNLHRSLKFRFGFFLKKSQ